MPIMFRVSFSTKPILVALLFGNATAAEPNNLLDPKLSQWEVFMGVPHTSVTGLPSGTHQADKPEDGPPMGLGNDPKGVFSVIEEDGEPVLKISGEIYGGLTTLKEFENYHFSCEMKFGEKKWPPREDALRDSGILYHCTGPHGAFWNVWMRCVEYQVQEGDMGDLFMLAGTGGNVRVRELPTIEKYDPKGIWDPTKPSIRIGRVKRSENFEKPLGEWNKLEVYTFGNQSLHLVNGHIVMAISNIRVAGENRLTKGKIQIQSEGAEAYYRKMKIEPISGFPEPLARISGLEPESSGSNTQP